MPEKKLPMSLKHRVQSFWMDWVIDNEINRLIKFMFLVMDPGMSRNWSLTWITRLKGLAMTGRRISAAASGAALGLWSQNVYPELIEYVAPVFITTSIAMLGSNILLDRWMESYVRSRK
ncbi:hypothetical protein HYW87_01860 [Candidatus Roizmanbacteria bacterium]|nr:hypothetical protein [Candidatus Roizmanbacteria bacterium]